jgi:hypothetical protein
MAGTGTREASRLTFRVARTSLFLSWAWGIRSPEVGHFDLWALAEATLRAQKPEEVTQGGPRPCAALCVGDAGWKWPLHWPRRHPSPYPAPHSPSCRVRMPAGALGTSERDR